MSCSSKSRNHPTPLTLHLWSKTNGGATKTSFLMDQAMGGTPMISMTSVQAKLRHVSKFGSRSDLNVSFQKCNFKDDEESRSVDLQE
jgi:hypothetical protein